MVYVAKLCQPYYDTPNKSKQQLLIIKVNWSKVLDRAEARVDGLVCVNLDCKKIVLVMFIWQ
jgi:hypothetical protein